MSATPYQPEAGTEDYIHVQETKKNGVPVSADAPPALYHPVNYAQVANLVGYEGTILHDPRKAGQKKASAPQIDTVKTSDKLETEADYRTRYEQLFRSVPPFNTTLDALKRIVDRAEAKLAEGPEGVAPVDESDAAHAARMAAEAAADKDKGLPATKTEWFALYQQSFPDDTTAYEAITVPQMRTKLGK